MLKQAVSALTIQSIYVHTNLAAAPKTRVRTAMPPPSATHGNDGLKMYRPSDLCTRTSLHAMACIWVAGHRDYSYAPIME